MANNNHCGCRGRRNSDNAYGCLNSVGGRWRWDNYPYYGGPCPDADGDYGCEELQPGQRPKVSVTLEDDAGNEKLVSVEED